MIAFLSDENFDNHILRGISRIDSSIDIIRVQDEGLIAVSDAEILEWAAKNGRVHLTHDVNTVTAYAYERVQQRLRMPGVFVVSKAVPLSTAIADLILIARASLEKEWEWQVRHLPLR